MPSDSSVARCVMTRAAGCEPRQRRATEKANEPNRPVHAALQNSMSTSRRSCMSVTYAIVLAAAIDRPASASTPSDEKDGVLAAASATARSAVDVDAAMLAVRLSVHSSAMRTRCC